MSLPKRIQILEEGPREGFQIEKGPIATARKIELIDALSRTGLRHIQIVSFVDPRRVPGMADAEEVVRGITPAPGITYTGLWLNDRGFERAVATGRLDIKGTIVLCGSETFLKRNQNRTCAEQLDAQTELARRYRDRGLAIERGMIMAAFGCNFEGEVPPARIADLAGFLRDRDATLTSLETGRRSLEAVFLQITAAGVVSEPVAEPVPGRSRRKRR